MIEKALKIRNKQFVSIFIYKQYSQNFLSYTYIPRAIISPGDSLFDLNSVIVMRTLIEEKIINYVKQK